MLHLEAQGAVQVALAAVAERQEQERLIKVEQVAMVLQTARPLLRQAVVVEHQQLAEMLVVQTQELQEMVELEFHLQLLEVLLKEQAVAVVEQIMQLVGKVLQLAAAALVVMQTQLLEAQTQAAVVVEQTLQQQAVQALSFFVIQIFTQLQSVRV
jgi:hypothetical protein